jgi:ATP-dependent RNA helicase DBP3
MPSTSSLTWPHPAGSWQALVGLLRQAEQEVPAALTKFGSFTKKKEHKLYGAFGKDVDMTKKATKIVFADDD